MPPPETSHRLDERLPALYVLCALFVSFLLVVLTPPFYTPDEENHAFRAAQLASGHILPQGGKNAGGGFIDTGLVRGAAAMTDLTVDLSQRFHRPQDMPEGRIPAALMATENRLRWTCATQFMVFPNTAVYPPTLYLPQILAWAAGKSANLSIVQCLRLARLLAVLCAVPIGWFALHISTVERRALFACLLLPTVLSLNASDSQDSVAFSIAALAAALIARAVRQQRTFRLAELALCTLLLFLCIGTRPGYLPLAGLLFIPALNLGGLQKRPLLQTSAAAALGALLLAAWQFAVRPFGLGIGPEADPQAQTLHIHQHPLLVAAVLLKTALLRVPVILAGGICRLGFNDAWFHAPEYLLLALTLATLLLSSRGALHRWPVLLLLGCMLVSALGLAAGAYIVWTPPGSNAVQGLQARYFIPMLILTTPIALPAVLQRRIGQLPSWIGEAAVALFVLCVLSTPWVAAHRFYGTGLIGGLRFALFS